MKQKGIKWIIVLVAAALLMLIGVQMYWITNAYTYRKDQLALQVKDILSTAGNETVQASTCFELFGKVFVKPKEGIYFAKQPLENKTDFVPADKKAPDSVKLFFLDKEEASIIGSNSLKFSHPVSVEFTMRCTYQFGDTTTMAYQKPQNQNPEELHYKDFREKLSGGNSVVKRLKMNVLDSSIRSLVGKAGLGSDYHYGIIRADNDSVEFASKASDMHSIKTSMMTAGLVGEEYFSHPYKLSLYFDSGNAMVFRTLWSILLVSALVILLLCYAFWYFVKTILAQKKLSEMKTDFINNMTHEFKTPITNIALAVENISEKGDLNGSTPYLRIIGEENGRLRENVERILQIASIDKEEITLNLDTVDINGIVERISQNMELGNYPGKPDIRFSMQAQNPFILADETHIINILYNLLDNAVKYCDKKPEVLVSVQNTNDGVVITVKDNGIGMDRETQKRVFEKFYRAHTGNIHNVKGFGLGLSYTKTLVELHHGTISLESEPGKGSIFRIFLPFAADFKSIEKA